MNRKFLGFIILVCIIPIFSFAVFVNEPDCSDLIIDATTGYIKDTQIKLNDIHTVNGDGKAHIEWIKTDKCSFKFNIILSDCNSVYQWRFIKCDGGFFDGSNIIYFKENVIISLGDLLWNNQVNHEFFNDDNYFYVNLFPAVQTNPIIIDPTVTKVAPFTWNVEGISYSTQISKYCDNMFGLYDKIHNVQITDGIVYTIVSPLGGQAFDQEFLGTADDIFNKKGYFRKRFQTNNMISFENFQSITNPIEKTIEKTTPNI